MTGHEKGHEDMTAEGNATLHCDGSSSVNFGDLNYKLLADAFNRNQTLKC